MEFLLIIIFFYTIASFHQYIFFCMFCHFLSLSERHWLVRIEIVFFAATNNRLSLIRSCLNQFLSFWNGKDNMLMRIGSLVGTFNATGITESWMIRMWNNIPIVAIWTFKLVKNKIACVAKKQSFINDNLNMYINDHLRMYTSDYALI